MRIRLGAIYPARIYARGWFGRVCKMGRMPRPFLTPFEKYETRRCKSCAQKCHVCVVQIKWRLKITIFHRNKNLQRSHVLINICFKQNLIICEKKATAEKGRIIKVHVFFYFIFRPRRWRIFLLCRVNDRKWKKSWRTCMFFSVPHAYIEKGHHCASTFCVRGVYVQSESHVRLQHHSEHRFRTAQIIPGKARSNFINHLVEMKRANIWLNFHATENNNQLK